MTVLATIVFSSGRLFVIGFGYLTLKPDYICVIDGVELPCEADYICQNQPSFREDLHAGNYVHNWV